MSRPKESAAALRKVNAPPLWGGVGDGKPTNLVLRTLGVTLRDEYNDYRLKNRLPKKKNVPDVYLVPQSQQPAAIQELFDIHKLFAGLDKPAAETPDADADAGADAAALVATSEDVQALSLGVRDREALMRGFLEGDEARAREKLVAALNRDVNLSMQGAWSDFTLREHTLRQDVVASWQEWCAEIDDLLLAGFEDSEEGSRKASRATNSSAGGKAAPKKDEVTEEAAAQTQVEAALRATVANLRQKNAEYGKMLHNVDVRENRRLQERLEIAEATIVELRRELALRAGAASSFLSVSQRSLSAAQPSTAAHSRAVSVGTFGLASLAPMPSYGAPAEGHTRSSVYGDAHRASVLTDAGAHARAPHGSPPCDGRDVVETRKSGADAAEGRRHKQKVSFPGSDRSDASAFARMRGMPCAAGQERSAPAVVEASPTQPIPALPKLSLGRLGGQHPTVGGLNLECVSDEMRDEAAEEDGAMSPRSRSASTNLAPTSLDFHVFSEARDEAAEEDGLQSPRGSRHSLPLQRLSRDVYYEAEEEDGLQSPRGRPRGTSS
eukprot:TRINITY_DN25334_c0_g1_i1.p1 TRINITY_DN25334_c0_g1~~TRINITY_DN25334_c0_g1_i1.p1  ORF type:complete len:552 (+),score=106.03 TRINITY_DN25334_c0_g1_i1:57-1712(+)